MPLIAADDTAHRLAAAICDIHHLDPSDLERIPSSDHAVFFVSEELVLKLFRPVRNCFEREVTALRLTGGQTRFQTPKMVCSGKFEGCDYLMMTRIRGQELDRGRFLAVSDEVKVEILTDLAHGLSDLHRANAGSLRDDWYEFVTSQAETFIARQVEHGVNRRIIEQLPAYIDESLRLVPAEPTVFLHGDVHLGNLRFDENQNISGLFDFADSRVGWHEYDLLAVGVLVIQGERELQREFFRAYGYTDSEMDEEMRRRLMMLTMLYETSDLRRYALRLRSDAVDLDLYELEKAIWAFV